MPWGRWEEKRTQEGLGTIRGLPDKEVTDVTAYVELFHLDPRVVGQTSITNPSSTNQRSDHLTTSTESTNSSNKNSSGCHITHSPSLISLHPRSGSFIYPWPEPPQIGRPCFGPSQIPNRKHQLIELGPPSY
ncbi:hypothetical protein CDAR_107141 [Caerostris darwini]|uniref:Uncharacterized protein n=1 Tax=Caerostris darwini TaxID=1538125 RepID=A0AAV4SZ29_9ARAC|nr:hypothetical protein CDAR_107141 [Caerostris darwini]